MRAGAQGRSRLLQAGVLMLDNGTPDAVFLNRDALKLSHGRFVARGSAASGQAIEVHAHRQPEVLIGHQSVPIAATVRNGNFGFTASRPRGWVLTF